MNRKLIRPNLADVKNQERDSPNSRDLRESLEANRSAPIVNKTNVSRTAEAGGEAGNSTGAKGRRPLQLETNAEIFYYKKQIDSHTVMIVVLQDNEEIKGTIEWYDRNALKINRQDAPNILLLKHNIKYMFKASDKFTKE